MTCRRLRVEGVSTRSSRSSWRARTWSWWACVAWAFSVRRFGAAPSVSPAATPDTRRRNMPRVTTIVPAGVCWLRHDPELAAHA